MIKHTLRAVPGEHGIRSGLGSGIRGIKPLSEGPMARAIIPDSKEWDGLQAASRLSGLEFIERRIRDGRASLVYCEMPTSSAEEKAKAAGLEPERVIKAIHARERYCGDRFMIVASGPRRIRMAGLLPEDYDGCSLELAGEPPPGMAHGTCTPFMPMEAAEAMRYIVIESPDAERRGRKGRALGKLGEMEADVSIGGTDALSHHLSVRIRYGEMVEALAQEYGRKVHIVKGIERM